MPLPFSRRALQTAPSFSRDFAGLKTLDHGVGPAITFTRASNATFFDASGTLQTAANDTPRFDHSGGSSLGLLIEEARTNSIRNSQAGGSTNGVIGSGGVMPTNWGTGTVSGISYEVIGTGTVGGFSYLDLKISGTNSSGSTVLPIFSFEATSVIVASSGQSWTGSLYIALQAGSLAGASSFNIDVTERDSGGAFLVASATGFTPTSALTRISHSRTFSNASTARTNHRVYFSVANGDSIDLTLRIAAPQLEQGAFATSYIPTTSAAATRAADSAVVTPISSFYNQAEGTLFAEYSRTTVAKQTYFLGFSDPTAGGNEEMYIETSGATPSTQRYQVRDGGVSQAAIGNYTSATANTIYKVAAGYAVDNFAVSQNGAAVSTDTSGTLPTVTRMDVGTGQLSSTHIRKIAYWPRRLSNTLLQQLTT
jgi:hypothetical protein